MQNEGMQPTLSIISFMRWGYLIPPLLSTCIIDNVLKTALMDLGNIGVDFIDLEYMDETAVLFNRTLTIKVALN